LWASKDNLVLFYFYFLRSKENSLKAQGAPPKYTGCIQEKNTHQDLERGNRAKKIYKARDIEKGTNKDPLKEWFKKTTI